MMTRSLGDKICAGLFAALIAALSSRPTLAGTGQPSPKQITFQEAVTPIADEIHWMHDFVNIIIFAITAFVLFLLLYVMWRFSEKRNPTPSRTTHNTTVEVLWTVIPVFILVAIAIPSFKLLYHQYAFPPPDVTIKAIGHAWNWTHELPDQGISVDSIMLQDSEREAAIKAGMPAEQVPRNLAVDNEVLVPVNKVVHVLVTSTDVIHAWTIPSFGVQGRCRARAHHRDLVQGAQGRHLFRPMLRAVRQGPRLHADRRARGEGADLQRLGRGAEGTRQEEGQGDHPQRSGRAPGQYQDRRQPADQLGSGRRSAAG